MLSFLPYIGIGEYGDIRQETFVKATALEHKPTKRLRFSHKTLSILSNLPPGHEDSCIITVDYGWKSCKVYILFKEEFLEKYVGSKGDKTKDTWDIGTFWLPELQKTKHDSTSS